MEKKKKTDEEVVHLRREISLLPAISFIVGSVVGGGIFIAPKGVLMNSGSVGLSLLVWGLCGIVSTVCGWATMNFFTEEIKNPNRTFPLAIISSMVTVTVCYVLVNMAYYSMMTPAELLQSDAVAVTFANRALHGMASVIPFLVTMSCLGSLNGGIFGSPRMMFVAAREDQWPPIFSMIHIRRNTPLPAVLLMVK